MNIITDTHIHSHHSSDAVNSINEIAREAVNKQIEIICITDHIDIDYPGDILFNKLDSRAYLSEIEKARSDTGDDITILTGLEIGIQPHLANSTASFAEEFKPDFIIGSTHCVKGEEISRTGLFHNRSKIEAYNRYFEAMLENIHSIEAFDSLGHLDFVERYYPGTNRELVYREHNEIIDEVLKLLIKKDKALEINTSGFRYKLGKPHPSKEVLTRYAQLGGKLITIGSDSHHSRDIGSGFDQIYTILKNAGFTSYFYYRKRTPFELPL